MLIDPRLELLDAILSDWQSRIGPDFEGYRNHCRRMALFTLELHACSEDEQRKLMIAAAHHDIGIWSDHTVDYLPPSSAQATRYLQAHGLQAWTEEIVQMIDEHHKFTRLKNPEHALAEAFRKGDLVDFSLGWLRHGLPRGVVRAIRAQYANAGFHKRLLQLAGSWFRQHPLSPPPFMKW